MENIEMLRIKMDRVYNSKIMNFIGAVIVLLAVRIFMASSFLSPTIAMVVAVIMGIAFYFSPGLSVFLFSAVVFLAVGHINGFLTVFIMAILIFNVGVTHLSAVALILTPLCFVSGLFFNPMYGLSMMIFIIGCYFFSKAETVAHTLFYGIYFGLWVLFSDSMGTAGIFYKKGFNYRVSTAESLSEFTENFYFNLFYERLMPHLAEALTALVITTAAAMIMYLLFKRIKIKNRKMAEDVKELVCFAIAAVVAICVPFAISTVFASDYEVGFFSVIVQALVAYIITRPFASEKVIKQHQREDKPQPVEKEKTLMDVTAAENTFEKWDSIAGYENTKEEIKAIIKPYIDKAEYEKMSKAGMKPVKGMLLFGPPGTGKTSIARVIASETRMKLFLVNAGEFMNKYVGESERNLANIFKAAKEAAPAIICFDEIETFLTKRENADMNYEQKIVNTFLANMDGFNELKDVFVIGTTNQPNLIDPAALRPGRFDKIIFVGAPDPEGRTALFRLYLQGKADVETLDIEKLVESTDRFTGADIKGVCEEAFRNNSYEQLSQEQLMAQIRKTRPSFTLDMKEEYYLWSKKYDRSSKAQDDNMGRTDKKLTWDDIKGMQELKELLKDKIESPMENAEKYKEYGIPASKGILFFGPPGCGKTFFAKVVADECNANFFTVNGPELLGGGIGQSEANLRQKFRDARETKPAIIFFDEIDAIAEDRSTGSGSVRLINQLLTEMDGMESLDGVMVIAATNRPEKLDSALMRAGRFDTKIYIPMPDELSRKELLVGSLGKIPYNLDLDLCSKELEGYTCADIVGIANKAKEFFVKRSISSGKDIPISDDDFKEILSKVKPSVLEAEINRYEKMQELESFL